MAKLTIQEQISKFDADNAQEMQRIRENILFCNTNNISVKIVSVVVNVSDIMGDVKIDDITLSVEDMLAAEKVSRFISSEPEQVTPTPIADLPPLPPIIEQPPLKKNESMVKQLLAKLKGAQR